MNFQICYFLIFIFLDSLLLIFSQITLLCSYIILGLKTSSALAPDSALSLSASTTGNIPMSTVKTTEGRRESLSFPWNRLLVLLLCFPDFWKEVLKLCNAWGNHRTRGSWVCEILHLVVSLLMMDNFHFDLFHKK